MHCRAPHDRTFARLREQRTDILDPVEALGEEDALHLAAVRQVLLEPHLRAAEPTREICSTAAPSDMLDRRALGRSCCRDAACRQRVKNFSIAASPAGRVVAMRRDSGCAVEVRCLLLHDRRHCDREYHSWALPDCHSSAGTVFYALCCTLWWAPRARSRRAGKRRPEKPCLRVDSFGCGRSWVQLQHALFFLLVEAEPEDTAPSLARRLALIISLQFLQG